MCHSLLCFQRGRDSHLRWVLQQGSPPPSTSSFASLCLGSLLRFVSFSFLHNSHTHKYDHTQRNGLQPHSNHIGNQPEGHAELRLSMSLNTPRPQVLAGKNRGSATATLQEWVADALNLPTAGRTLSFLTLILRNVKEFMKDTHAHSGPETTPRELCVFAHPRLGLIANHYPPLTP